ncbi:hypothetical protein ACWDV6_51370, partial [Rhodococcus koreensis]
GEVEVRRYDGVAHGFFTEVRTLRKARQAVADTAHFLRAHLLRGPVRADARLRWETYLDS